ncbi:hypothetical protein CR155_12770 [Pollutimonas nitritireducens]|uniref:Transmembrane protein n=1 Tax=Pollutimonas nitritireducens TaxID=2045209 RepID=A0A2N4UF71_9BURK|nr:YfiR family protein [Pollutimonas nitritireducens]PLC53673.1 hypothetical protein CR155_12770 [Pollutimonas nitritireducens]
MIAPCLKGLLSLTLSAFLGGVQPAFAQVDENALKAAFIYNFAMFTTWKAHPSEGPVFNVCVGDDSPLRSALGELSGRPVDNRSWTVRTMPPVSNASICQIVVYDPQNGGLANEIAAAVYGNSVLLVTDGGEARKNHAVITLTLEKDLLHFDVDLGAAKERGVSLSSNLLRLARSVL